MVPIFKYDKTKAEGNKAPKMKTSIKSGASVIQIELYSARMRNNFFITKNSPKKCKSEESIQDTLSNFKTYTEEQNKRSNKRKKSTKTTKMLKYYNSYKLNKDKKKLEKKMNPIFNNENSNENTRSESADLAGDLSIRTFNPKRVQSESINTEDEELYIQIAQNKMGMMQNRHPPSTLLKKRRQIGDTGINNAQESHMPFDIGDADNNVFAKSFQFKDKKNGTLIRDSEEIFTNCAYIGNFVISSSGNKYIIQRKNLKKIINMSLEHFKDSKRERIKMKLQREICNNMNQINSDKEFQEGRFWSKNNFY